MSPCTHKSAKKVSQNYHYGNNRKNKFVLMHQLCLIMGEKRNLKKKYWKRLVVNSNSCKWWDNLNLIFWFTMTFIDELKVVSLLQKTVIKKLIGKGHICFKLNLCQPVGSLSLAWRPLWRGWRRSQGGCGSYCCPPTYCNISTCTKQSDLETFGMDLWSTRLLCSFTTVCLIFQIAWMTVKM